MSTRPPTHDQLNEQFGFRVPRSYHRLIELATRIGDAEYPWNAFDLLMLTNLDAVGREGCSYTAPGDFAILGWTGGDSGHYGFLLDDEIDDGRERPIAVWYPDTTETQILAADLCGLLSYLCALSAEDELDRASPFQKECDRLAAILQEEFEMMVPNSSAEALEEAWQWRLRSGAVPTEDRIGVMLPPASIDRAYPAGLIWRKPGGWSLERLPADERRLDEAEKRLKRGEVGTALVIARDFRFHHWYDDWKTTKTYIRRTCDLLEAAYRELGRERAARTTRERTEDAIANVL